MSGWPTRDIDGIICANRCFQDSFSLARKRKTQTLQIDLNGFDGFITTAQSAATKHPSVPADSARPNPLEYGRTLDHLPSFSSRLLATINARRIYVSEDAERKFNASILSVGSRTGTINETRVLKQPPSLQFPGDALDWEARTSELKVLSSDQKKLHSLLPDQFLLFNSSVVPHKNLLFALRAYMESNIERLGVKFCITGQPQHDAYSRAVTDVASKHKSVIFTGYVDEATKRHLYLNALD